MIYNERIINKTVGLDNQEPKRLKRENMATQDEVKEDAKKLLELMPSYKFEDEDKLSRIVLLKRKGSRHENIIKNA